MSTILWWGLVFDGTATYVGMMNHGGFTVLVAIDGLLLNRIPLRMKQMAFIEMLAVLYVLWMVIHAFSGIGNPIEDDDTIIYESVAWKKDPVQATVVSVLAVFVLSPLCFAIPWGLGRLPPRRLCNRDDLCFQGEQEDDCGDVEATKLGQIESSEG